MAKSVSSLELPLRTRPKSVSLTSWLYSELRAAMLDGRLKRGARLPSTRDFATQYGVSRGIATLVMEQLRDEGYLTSRTGSGTWVSEIFPDDLLQQRSILPSQPAKKTPAPKTTPPWMEHRPFLAADPATDLFPVKLWSRLTSQQWKRGKHSLLGSGDPAGAAPLRIAIAEYLGSSRGVRCHPQQVIIVTGTQQALDLTARALLKPGDAAWLEDPGYFGARWALQNAGAKVVPVPVDDNGIDVQKGKQLAPRAKLAYVTPAHQFPTGVTMTIERRNALLRWARSAKAIIIEDDYDSEFRFSGAPIPALQGLDRNDTVLFIGSFTKVLFPGLRIGYMVVPERLIDRMERLRFEIDFWASSIHQAVLTQFITEGHLGRHIRRMREAYGERLAALKAATEKYLGDGLRIPDIHAGLATAGYYSAPIDSVTLSEKAAKNGVTVHAFDRFTLRKQPIHALLLGFAAFEPKEIDRGMQKLAAVIEKIS